jgi:hypothetical protein
LKDHPPDEPSMVNVLENSKAIPTAAFSDTFI